MSSEDPRPLHETTSQRLERAGGGRKPILGTFGSPALVAAVLLGIILLIVGLGIAIYHGGEFIFQSHIEKFEPEEDID